MIRSITINQTLAFLVAGLLVAWIVLPHPARAQVSSDLRAAVQGALLSDPRTSSLSPLEIEGIVSILADEAAKQGVTVEDMQWRPQNTEDNFSAGNADAAVFETCGTSLLCAFNEAFGFVGPDQTIPYIIGAASMGLIWIVAEMMHRRRYPLASDSAPRAM